MFYFTLVKYLYSSFLYFSIIFYKKHVFLYFSQSFLNISSVFFKCFQNIVESIFSDYQNKKIKYIFLFFFKDKELIYSILMMANIG